MYLRPLPFRTTESVFSFAQATPSPSSAPPLAYRFAYCQPSISYGITMFAPHETNFFSQIASLEGHTAPVTSVIVVPASSPASKILCYCWTASLDGSIRHWDFSVPDLMKKVDIKMPIFSMVILMPCYHPMLSLLSSVMFFSFLFLCVCACFFLAAMWFASLGL